MTSAQILVVEDEGITAKDLESRLKHLGYRVAAVARSGAEAIDKVGVTQPDLVLMDIRLKGAMDGVQAAAAIRERFGTPVTYLTAFADEATLARAQGTAPYGYLVKPFDERELHATIQMALHRHQLDQQVAQINRLKADMIAMVSHELRTAFGTIVGFTELLLNGEFGPLSAEQTTGVQSIERNLQRMLELIRSTLDFNRFEHQRTVLDLRRTEIGDLVGEIARDASDFPRRSEVRLLWEVAPELPAVLTDPVKLTVAIRNLVVNALKYTEHGSVTVTVQPRDGGVEFCVADTGVGIPPEGRETIFEPFSRLTGPLSHSAAGLGLGLYITRRLIEMLGGTITLDSAKGLGSTFRVRIPIEARPSPTRPPHRVSPSRTAPQ